MGTRVTSEQHSFKGTGSMLLIHELGSISFTRRPSSPDLPVISGSGRMEVSTGENATAESRAALRGKGLQGGGRLVRATSGREALVRSGVQPSDVGFGCWKDRCVMTNIKFLNSKVMSSHICHPQTGKEYSAIASE